MAKHSTFCPPGMQTAQSPAEKAEGNNKPSGVGNAEGLGNWMIPQELELDDWKNM